LVKTPGITEQGLLFYTYCIANLENFIFEEDVVVVV